MTVPTPPPPELAELLDAELAYDPVTVQGFTDHLPMALVALHRLGASDARLAEFAEDYSRRLLPARPETEALRAAARADDRSRRHRRHGARLPARRAGGHRQRGLPLRDPPRLRDRGRAPGQVAAALAYWDEADEPLTPEAPPESSPDPLALLGALAADPALGGRSFGRGSISGQMARVAATPEFAAAAGLEITPDALDRIAAAARALHAATGDFTALHAVTGTHATRVVLPFLDDSARARRAAVPLPGGGGGLRHHRHARARRSVDPVGRAHLGRDHRRRDRERRRARREAGLQRARGSGRARRRRHLPLVRRPRGRTRWRERHGLRNWAPTCTCRSARCAATTATSRPGPTARI